MVTIDHYVMEEIDRFIDEGLLTRHHFPLGAIFSNDIAGPWLDTAQFQLHPGMDEAAKKFTATLLKYNLTFVGNTNGNEDDAIQPLNALLEPKQNPRAISVGEGGNVIFYKRNGSLERVVLNPAEEVEAMHALPGMFNPGNNALMHLILNNTQASDGDAPIRTPFHTKIGLTFPDQYSTLEGRLNAAGIKIRDFIPDFDAGKYKPNGINQLLNFGRTTLETAVSQNSELRGKIGKASLNASNRRLYLGPAHAFLPSEFEYDAKRGIYVPSRKVAVPNNDLLTPNKGNGVYLAAQYMRSHVDSGFPLYDIGYSIHIADRAVETNAEGGRVLSSSERAAITDDATGKHARLLIHVTMNPGEKPTIGTVEGVTELCVGSGLEALGIIKHVYGRLYGNAPVYSLIRAA